MNSFIAQVLGRYIIQKNIVYIPKSIKESRMLENKNIFHFEITEDEIQELDSLTSGEALDAYKNLYQKCVLRDTPLEGSLEGVKLHITID